MNKGIINAPAPSKAAVDHLESLAERHTLAALSAKGRFEQAVALGRGMADLKEALGQVVVHLMPLQGSTLGFVTDKDSEGGYPAGVVTECLIEAVLRGVRPIGNEFNIISKRCYITKNGYAHLLRSHKGLTDLKTDIGIPVGKTGGAVVTASASWRLDGKPDSLKRDFPVKTNAGSGADQIQGKATRKLYAAVYTQITGSEQSGLDGEVGDTPDLLLKESRADQVLAKLMAGDGTREQSPGPPTDEQHAHLLELWMRLDMPPETFEAICRDLGADPRALTSESAARVMSHLEKLQEAS